MTKENDNNQGNKNLSVSDMYIQNWEHVRHIENERLGFTSIYFVIIAAIVAFLSQAKISASFTAILLLLLFLFSIIGTLMSFRLMADLEAHGKHLYRIVNDSNYSRYFTFGAESGWTTRFMLRDIFPIMYILLSILFLTLFIIVLVCPELIQGTIQ